MMKTNVAMIAALAAACTSSAPQVTCATGTSEQAGTCIPDVTCGSGTHASDGSCVPDDAPGVTCGSGTHASDGSCVADVDCGPGTHVDNGACVPDVPPPPGGYQIRVVSDTIAADGHSKIPVFAIGTNPDGTPATDQVVFNTDRPGAGTFTPAAPTLGPVGTTSYYVPCNATTPGCTGAVTLTLALASAPTVPVAEVMVTLVAPTGVYTAAPCLTGGNVMFFDGNDYIYSGTMTVNQGTFSASGSDNHLEVDVTPAGQNQGSWWYLEFDSSQLSVPLDVGVYDMAERYPFESPDHPGLSIYGDGRGCNTLTGSFEVHENVRDASGTVSATVSFEQHCEGGASVLNGCIHYAR